MSRAKRLTQISHLDSLGSEREEPSPIHFCLYFFLLDTQKTHKDVKMSRLERYSEVLEKFDLVSFFFSSFVEVTVGTFKYVNVL